MLTSLVALILLVAALILSIGAFAITSAQQQQSSVEEEEEEDLFFRGNEAAQQGRFEEAIEYYDRALAIDPDATTISGQVNY